MSARILIVDDTPMNLRLFEAKLTAEYFDVLTASDGPGGLAVAEREQPDLILLDVMMPKMDGFEVCRRLRANPRTWHIPVVMVTALTDVTDRVCGLEAGADDFLSKPVNDIALFARVRSLVRLKRLIDELRDRQEAAGLEVMEQAVHSARNESMTGHVLLVNGLEKERQRLASWLTAANHSVAQSDDLPAALDYCRSHPDLDLAIIAIDVAGQDGLRLCSQLRSSDETRHLPILLVLEEADLTHLAKGLDLGVTDYLFRPVDQNELLARARTQIRRRRYYNDLRALLDRGMSMAFTDPLTGIYNRRYMEVYIERKLAEAAERGKPLALMLFDIDHFKTVNDTYGHTAGDGVLKAICHRIAESVRDVDLVARYGGEEIVVVMPDMGAERAAAVAERLRGQIADLAIRTEEIPAAISITLSVGVTVGGDPADTARTLIEQADRALYQAKREGRNRVSFFKAA